MNGLEAPIRSCPKRGCPPNPPGDFLIPSRRILDRLVKGSQRMDSFSLPSEPSKQAFTAADHSVLED
jgi:hypothetical protein